MERGKIKFKLEVSIISLMVLLVCLYISIFLAHYTYNTDFPLYYSTAKKILDSNTPNIEIYNIDTANKYSIPEDMEIASFPYSMPAAYIISPLALIPYFKAKSAMIFINILMYLAAITIALQLGGLSDQWFAYTLAILCLWPPFIQNMRLGQINAIILFLIAVGVFAAAKNRPILCGIFLAIASLFKLFPIGIAMLLGIKNRRIFASCLLAFVISFLIPGSPKWIEAISSYPRYYNHYNPIYLWLKQFGFIWFWIYAATIAGFSAFIAYRARSKNYLILTSFAIPSVLLTMPIIEYAHFTLLMFSYAYLIASARRSNRLLLTTIFISLIIISISFFFPKLSLPVYMIKSFRLLGLFLLWAALLYNLISVHISNNQTA